MRFSRNLTANTGINLAVFFVLFASLLRYFTGLALFSPLYIAVAVLLLLLLTPKRVHSARPMVWILLLMLLGSMLVSLLNFGEYAFRGLFYALVILVSALLGLTLAKNRRIDLVGASRTLLYVFFVFFVFKAITVGMHPDQINLYLANSSRNAVSAIVIFLQLFYSASYFMRFRVFPKVTPVLTFAMCVLCFGRSGVAFGFLLLILPWVHYFFEARKLSAGFVLFALMSLMALPTAVVYFNVTDRVIEETNFRDRAFESPRLEMYDEYLSDISLWQMSFGRSFEGLPTIQEYEENPHNSLILGHHFMGLPFLVWLLATLWISIVGLFGRDDSKWLFAVCMLFVGRASLDILSLPGLFDLIFFYIFFSALNMRQPTRGVEQITRSVGVAA